MDILVIHPGGLGDIILSLPAVALLRNRYPSARLTIAGNVDHLMPVVSGYAESIVSISTLPLHYLYVLDSVPNVVAEFYRAFDLIVSWTGGSDPVFNKNFKEIHPDVRIASWSPAAGEMRHVSQMFIDSLNIRNNADIMATPTPITVNQELIDEGMQWLIERGWHAGDSLIAIHPGAGSKLKRWPVGRFTELARHLVLQEGRNLLVVEGDAERGLSSEIMKSLPRDSVIFFDSMRLSLLAAVLAQCNLFVGNDSGVAHLAASLRVPSIVIFGPTLPQHWAPLGREVRILRNPAGCRACAAAVENHSCLENITVEDVIQNLPAEALAKAGKPAL